MTITELISATNNCVPVRIRVLDGPDIVGKTGVYLTDELLKNLRKKHCQNATVVAVVPLWSARELYIECVKVLE